MGFQLFNYFDRFVIINFAGLLITHSLLFCLTILLKCDGLRLCARGPILALLAVLSYVYGKGDMKMDCGSRQFLATVAVCLWGTRLTIHSFNRKMLLGEIMHYGSIKKFSVQYSTYWVFHTFWLFFVSLPIILLNCPFSYTVMAANKKLNGFDCVGFTMFMIGLYVEGVADRQRVLSCSASGNYMKWCNTGMWRVSRNPDYFGEVLMWWGLFIVSLNGTMTIKWIGLTSPLYVMIFRFVLTGIPRREARYDLLYHQDPEYSKYKQCTSPVIPLPRFIYKRMPLALKHSLFFEVPFSSWRSDFPRLWDEEVANSAFYDIECENGVLLESIVNNIEAVDLKNSRIWLTSKNECTHSTTII